MRFVLEVCAVRPSSDVHAIHPNIGWASFRSKCNQKSLQIMWSGSNPVGFALGDTEWTVRRSAARVRLATRVLRQVMFQVYLEYFHTTSGDGLGYRICWDHFTNGWFVMEIERVMITSRRFMMVEILCENTSGRFEMVPHVLDYKQEVRRGWTMSDRFVESCDVLKAMDIWIG